MGNLKGSAVRRGIEPKSAYGGGSDAGADDERHGIYGMRRRRGDRSLAGRPFSRAGCVT